METVKDCFVGVSGAPEKVENHAEKILMMALDMRDVVTYVHDPRPEFEDKPDEHTQNFQASGGPAFRRWASRPTLDPLPE